MLRAFSVNGLGGRTLLHGLLITRDEDLLVERWFARHASLFATLAVLDGSDGPLTREVASRYANVRYARDPADGAINDQTLRRAAWSLLADIAAPGDWVMIAHVDEWPYHAPAVIAARADAAGVDSVVWNALHVLPHDSEKAAVAAAIEQTGLYDPVAELRHFWYKFDPTLNKIGATRELRMFRVPAGSAEWGSFNGWVAPVNLPGEPLAFTKRGVVKRFNRPSRLDQRPSYFHYKLVDLGPEHFRAGTNHFARSRLGTGLGGRRIRSFDDCFFSTARPWNQKNHTRHERFDGELPDGHVFNSPGNAARLAR